MQKFMGREYEGLEEGDYNPQSEIRYTSPEELKLSEMSEEDLKQGLEDIKRGVTDYTVAEEPIVTGWIKEELKKRKNEGKLDHEVVNDFSIDAIKDNFTPPGAKSQKKKLKEEVDTNDNGEIEVDEMADFQKSLDDYAAKNKKGRDDIPVTTRR